jgi:transcriptional repressor NrdR
MVNDLEAELQQLGRAEVASSEIGERVMDRLRDLDEIAYIRFASVYRPFSDLESLKEELRALGKPAGSSPA